MTERARIVVIRDPAGDLARLLEARPERPVVEVAGSLFDALEQTLEPGPDLPDQRLVPIEHVKIDQPAHDDVGDHDEPDHVQQHQKDREKRSHVARGPLPPCVRRLT